MRNTWRSRSLSVWLLHEKPCSGVNASAETMAISKLVLLKYSFAAGEEVERLSFISCPPTTVMSTFFFCASSIATAMPLVNMLHFMSGISLERYIAVVPPSIKMLVPSSIRVAAFCAMTIFASMFTVVFLV